MECKDTTRYATKKSIIYSLKKFLVPKETSIVLAREQLLALMKS